ncbi:RloB family protein, partial [Levilactobacillus brevis]
MSRKSKNLIQKKIIAIYCEGESEKAYFEMLSTKYNSKANVHTEKIKIEACSGAKGTVLVDEAISKINNIPKKEKVDQAYIVFDRDDLSNDELQNCSSKAKENNIKVIFSSISFEVWILLHFERWTRAFTAQQLNTKLSGENYFNQNYEDFKGKRYDGFLYVRVKQAVANAKYLSQQNNDDFLNSDPYT